MAYCQSIRFNYSFKRTNIINLYWEKFKNSFSLLIYLFNNYLYYCNSASTYWDDGNNLNGDGCNSSCAIETGFSWAGGSATTKDICSEICGDGKRFSTSSTSWDDANTVNGDGWNSSWTIEVGWNWSGGTPTTKDTWTEVWGDGKRFNSILSYWDDGNTLNGDGCSSTCTIETGFTCTGGSSSAQDTWIEVWGDGKRFNSLSNNLILIKDIYISAF